MALPKQYTEQGCSLARALEIVGERWTLLIIRDAFYGVRRFGDFVEHLDIPRAVLSDRLKDLVDNGVMVKATAPGRARADYELTEMGRELWPVVHGLTQWGDEHFASKGPPRFFEHVEDGGRIDSELTCETCHRRIDVEDTRVVPGPGLGKRSSRGTVGEALKSPHRLLDPLPV
jgi:DNA-binding HxlR family transcriptional regulator